MTERRSGGRPVVVYIAGSGRSGTTLLERMVGAVPGYVNVGELIDLFRRVAIDDERCGCGETFSTCPFWQEVGDRAFNGWGGGILDEMRGLQHEVARQRYLAHNLLPVKTAVFRRNARTYRGHYASLYRAIADTAGASTIVDASKWPAQAAALVGPEIDLRVIHVQRDVRGVAWSMGKDHVARPQDTHGRDLMESTGVKASALRWSACQSEVALLRLTRVPLVRIRYEDLIADARAQITGALTTVELPPAAGDLSHINGSAVELGASHGLSGNPSRFREGATRLALDEAWRTQMPVRDKVVVSAIGLPHLLRLPSRTAAQELHSGGQA